MKYRGVQHILDRRFSLIGLAHHAWLKLNRYEQYVDRDGYVRTGRHLRNGDTLKLDAPHLMRMNLRQK